MKKRKILYISGTRADWGLIQETLLSIKKNPSLQLEIVATGMHLMPEFGDTLKEIKKDEFDVTVAHAVYQGDDKTSMAVFLGEFVQVLAKKIKTIQPDIILLQGDRAEILAGAICGAYLSIPTAHVSGGDVSSTVDDSVRHAITKLASIHFPLTQKSGQRIINMGEEPWRVHVVGFPGLDEIVSKPLIPKREIGQKYHLDISKPIMLVLQHPVTLETGRSGQQMVATLDAIKALGCQTIIIYPNADAGAREMIRVIEKYRKYPFIKIYKNIPRLEYLSLLAIVNVMIGNSSSGIVETPIFHVPVVNIGSRQRGRERAENVIDTDYEKEAIKKAIKTALYDKKFIKKVNAVRNPYGDGKAGSRIAKVISQIALDKRLLEKRITYRTHIPELDWNMV